MVITIELHYQWCYGNNWIIVVNNTADHSNNWSSLRLQIGKLFRGPGAALSWGELQPEASTVEFSKPQNWAVVVSPIGDIYRNYLFLLQITNHQWTRSINFRSSIWNHTVLQRFTNQWIASPQPPLSCCCAAPEVNARGWSETRTGCVQATPMDPRHDLIDSCGSKHDLPHTPGYVI